MKYLILFFVVCMLSCSEDSLPVVTPSLVVEGYIENDGYPVVIVTKSMPVATTGQNINDMEKYLVRWAKVSVVNGQDTVVLTGKYDRGYFPPYIYTTSNIKGRVGETYDLVVEYDGSCAHATTTITTPPVVKGYRVEKCDDSDTLYQICALMTAKENEDKSYQFFSRVGNSTKQFHASLFGGYNDGVSASDYEVPVYRGRQFLKKDYTPYFSANDTVAVKCCRLDETEYRFWKAYMAPGFLSEGSILSVSNNLPSNIVGGTGYWFGYGSVTSYFIIRDSVGADCQIRP